MYIQMGNNGGAYFSLLLNDLIKTFLLKAIMPSEIYDLEDTFHKKKLFFFLHKSQENC